MKILYRSILLSLTVLFSACKIDEQVDPNGASLGSVQSGASFAGLNNIVTGIEARMRNGHDTYCTATGTVSRELYLFDADPRNLTDLTGLDGATLDNNSFYLTSPYNNRYRVIKNCNILLEAVEQASTEVTAANRDGYRGFANTIKAYQLLIVLNLLDTNGIRTDVSDPDNLGPFETKAEALTTIRTLLNTALSQLNNAGAEFSFALTRGFAGFDAPSTFAEFNRAIAARVALYDQDYASALSLLNDSFFDLNGNLAEGPEHVYSTAGPDILNNLFKNPGQSGDQIIVNNDLVASAEAGDLRLAAKTAGRVDTTALSGFNGNRETRLYPTSTSSIDIIRNEELVLIYAEANIQISTAASLADAVTALNIIRANAGLAPYAGTVDQASLINEMLNQRRYSFWAEGHRMVDLRRYGRLNDTFVVIDPNLDPDTGEELSQTIWTLFPIPLADDF